MRHATLVCRLLSGLNDTTLTGWCPSMRSSNMLPKGHRTDQRVVPSVGQKTLLCFQLIWKFSTPQWATIQSRSPCLTCVVFGRGMAVVVHNGVNSLASKPADRKKIDRPPTVRKTEWQFPWGVRFFLSPSTANLFGFSFTAVGTYTMCRCGPRERPSSLGLS